MIKMAEWKSMCPVCGSSTLMLKYEASYVYSYAIDSNIPGTLNFNEFLPFMYDSREQKDIKQYIECSQCSTQIPCYFHEQTRSLDIKSIEKVLNQKV
jgi:DNA-directed RNA polymerase subunit M/transcription elongation factor TFIIS